ncbi:hypothetical protein [Nostoc sp. FACHB-280]|nr:hypothetical protein [Nostoc sp. FACHB-280]
MQSSQTYLLAKVISYSAIDAKIQAAIMRKMQAVDNDDKAKA